MKPLPDLPALRALLLRRAQLLSAGRSDKQIQASVRAGAHIRLHPGWFVRADRWNDLSPTDQHLLRTICAHEASGSPPVFSHRTAAAILGLPLLKFDTRKVHVLLPGESTYPSSERIVRHHQGFAADELSRTAGLVHTGLTRTLIDIARSAPFADGVVAGDEAIRRLRLETGLSAEEQRELLLQRVEALPRTPGVRRARNVVRFLDGDSESPLESLFRLQFARLGFEVRTQVPVRSPNGGFYRMDLELVGFGVYFEADGKAKYLDAAMRNGRSIEQVMLDERQRENWVSGTRDYRVLRGSWEHAQTPEATAARLRAFGITPPIDRDARIRGHLY